MKHKTIYCAAALFALAIPALAQDFGDPAGPSGNATTVTNATGTISQLNYAPNGVSEGFLVGTNIC